ncbi:NAD(P)-dependent dehydrogenase, short-chain alcohol dehydrogenase family [Erythrobacter litoralis]|jgi:NAD(P)-dependent dehydrogenase (short-subunit alcohol dehydrogenase family)|uniref:Oxidoreductase n=1 Tax=Erythrobacter litoralis TaxID=39960 RepID=A0A074N507_9SPHN|nr:SDR family oxidoreductase [Erythrobacter litoralis]AOL24205.1 NAD(P)-dependent dehydrogenase, short-chain alcohol dehydrogenase family [Erythrobacter litoralis]KEO99278.1 oxidoreductase [Erythrobacter litoralis]MEE4338529.1 SDR family oxidoreductase [Erythrobacter sp.]
MDDTRRDFEGRSALVTGAASGIGAACAQALAARGAAKLFLNDIDAGGLDGLALGRSEVVPIIGSVADPLLWADLEEDLAGLDHAIVNAGIGAGGALMELDLAAWRRVMEVNLDGSFLTLSTAMRAMRGKGGSAVVISSTTGLKPVPGIGPYGVSKAAVAHMARIAAVEGAAQNIRVNAIAPGGVDTAIWDSSEDFKRSVEAHGREATLKAMAKTTPSGRFASSAEMAETILFLLSDAAANVTGHVMVSDGGYTL